MHVCVGGERGEMWELAELANMKERREKGRSEGKRSTGKEWENGIKLANL